MNNVTDKDILDALEDTVTIKLSDLNTSIRIAINNPTDIDIEKYHRDPHVRALVFKLRDAFDRKNTTKS